MKQYDGIIFLLKVFPIRETAEKKETTNVLP